VQKKISSVTSVTIVTFSKVVVHTSVSAFMNQHEQEKSTVLCRHFLLLGLDTSDTYIGKEKLINYPLIAGYPLAWGLHEWVWSSCVQQPDSVSRVRHRLINIP
jgi:hypothetical protein